MKPETAKRAFEFAVEAAATAKNASELSRKVDEFERKEKLWKHDEEESRVEEDAG